MKARQLKKLSKKIVSILPVAYENAWVDREVMESAWKEGTRVSGELRIGGELDCWGEGTDDFSVYEDFIHQFDLFNYPYPEYPGGHKWEGLPNPPGTTGRFTGRVAIEHAKVIATTHRN